jgi:protein CpxP
MNTLHKHFLAALAVLSLGATLNAQAQAQDSGQHPLAQPGAHAMHGQHRKPSPEQMAALRAQHIAKLHDALKITPAQESAWNSFVASMQPQARAGHDRTQDRSAWANMTAPQRMAKMIDLQKQRTAALEQRQGALNSFYAVLSPDQKKTFDERAGRMQGRFGGHGGERGGEHPAEHGAEHGATARS